MHMVIKSITSILTSQKEMEIDLIERWRLGDIDIDTGREIEGKRSIHTSS